MRSREHSALPKKCNYKIMPFSRMALCQEDPTDCQFSELQPLMV